MSSQNTPDIKVDQGHFTARRKVALAVTAFIYLAAAVAVYFYIDKEALDAARALPPWVFVSLLGLSLVNYALRCSRWVVLSHYLKFGVPLRRSVLYYLAGLCLTATPGKAGEAVRLWFLKSGHGVPYSRSMAIMLADRIIDVWALLILAIVSIAGFTAYHGQGIALACFVAVVSVPILFPQRFEPLVGWGCRVLRFNERWRARVDGLMTTLAALSSWRTYGLTLLPTIAGWLAECAALYILLAYFGVEVSFLNVVFVFSFSTIVGALSMLPGGLGGTEASIVFLLRALGVDLGIALVATLIIRIATLWFAVAIGVVLMPAAMNAAARASAGRAAAAPRLESV